MSTLKEQTYEKHKEAETQAFIKEIFQKRVDKNIDQEERRMRLQKYTVFLKRQRK